MKKKLIVLAGPTAVGKTKASIELAKAVNGEIISADSVQVYKKLNIGSAKITASQMQGVTHHLIDVLEPDEEFNVAIFKKLVFDAIEDISSRGKVPILVGGTGFYIQAILKDIDFDDGQTDPKLREKLELEASEYGSAYMFNKLRQVDPESCEIIDCNNTKRVIRALEFYSLTGQKISEHNILQSKKESPFDYKYFVLTDDRQLLYERIDRRVDDMMEEGLLEEVKGLKALGIPREAVSMQSLGYRQILDYLYGEYDLETAVYQIKLQTRHFAKRQITWFKREKDVIWIDKSEFNHNEDEILQSILEKLGDM